MHYRFPTYVSVCIARACMLYIGCECVVTICSVEQVVDYIAPLSKTVKKEKLGGRPTVHLANEQRDE